AGYGPPPGAREDWRLWWDGGAGPGRAGGSGTAGRSDPAMGAGGQAPVPDVGDEEGDVARGRDHRYRPLLTPLEVVVPHTIDGGSLARGVAAGDDARRPGFDGAVPDEQVGCYREHGIGDALVPR